MQSTCRAIPPFNRRPARELSPDSDLGDRLVTVAVDRLEPAEIDAALARGYRAAADFVAQGLIEAAIIYLEGRERVCGRFAAPLAKTRLLEEAANA